MRSSVCNTDCLILTGILITEHQVSIPSVAKTGLTPGRVVMLPPTAGTVFYKARRTPGGR